MVPKCYLLPYRKKRSEDIFPKTIQMELQENSKQLSTHIDNKKLMTEAEVDPNWRNNTKKKQQVPGNL